MSTIAVLVFNIMCANILRFGRNVKTSLRRNRDPSVGNSRGHTGRRVGTWIPWATAMLADGIMVKQMETLTKSVLLFPIFGWTALLTSLKRL